MIQAKIIGDTELVGHADPLKSTIILKYLVMLSLSKHRPFYLTFPFTLRQAQGDHPHS